MVWSVQEVPFQTYGTGGGGTVVVGNDPKQGNVPGIYIYDNTGELLFSVAAPKPPAFGSNQRSAQLKMFAPEEGSSISLGYANDTGAAQLALDTLTINESEILSSNPDIYGFLTEYALAFLAKNTVNVGSVNLGMAQGLWVEHSFPTDLGSTTVTELLSSTDIQTRSTSASPTIWRAAYSQKIAIALVTTTFQVGPFTVNFPAGRFANAPLVSVTQSALPSGATKVAFKAINTTTAKTDIYCDSTDGANFPAAVSFNVDVLALDIA